MKELKDFMREGRIFTANTVFGRGDDRTFAVFLDFGSNMQGFTSYCFGEGPKAEAKLESFCNDLAAFFGKQSLHEIEGLQAVALYEKRLVGRLSSNAIVGLINPETGKKFIAAEWFEKNYGVKYESPLERERASLLARRAALHQEQAQINRELDSLEDNVYEWRS